ncbi:MAG: sensor histidine kinase [Gammaproteobacteria bacterium]|nr:MAG: sensor histidine kinase [Gammaproteobacteria bacterium]
MRERSECAAGSHAPQCRGVPDARRGPAERHGRSHAAGDRHPQPAQQFARPRCIEVAAEVRGADVLIRVDDSGPGIVAGLSKRLFEPFVTSKISGMGLGLSLSRTLLRHLGGDLWSEPGRLGGASFVIRLATRPSPQTSL